MCTTVSCCILNSLLYNPSVQMCEHPTVPVDSVEYDFDAKKFRLSNGVMPWRDEKLDEFVSLLSPSQDFLRSGQKELENSNFLVEERYVLYELY